MTIAVNVAFQGIETSEVLRADIEQHAGKLERFSRSLQSCDAVVRREEGSHRHGNRFRVRLTATLPGGQETAEKSHQDAHMAAHQAFAALRRQLEDFVRTRRGD
jgi:ribosomal subunit interface protein